MVILVIKNNLVARLAYKNTVVKTIYEHKNMLYC